MIPKCSQIDETDGALDKILPQQKQTKCIFVILAVGIVYKSLQLLPQDGSNKITQFFNKYNFFFLNELREGDN